MIFNNFNLNNFSRWGITKVFSNHFFLKWTVFARKYSISEKFLWKQASLKSGLWAELKEPAFYHVPTSAERDTPKRKTKLSPSFFPRKKLLFFRGDKTCLDPFSERNSELRGWAKNAVKDASARNWRCGTLGVKMFKIYTKNYE